MEESCPAKQGAGSFVWKERVWQDHALEHIGRIGLLDKWRHNCRW